MERRSAYVPDPTYLPTGNPVTSGWDAVAATLPDRPIRLAIDGPWVVDWDDLVQRLLAALRARSTPVRTCDLRELVIGWDRLVQLTGSRSLPDDPDFLTLSDLPLVRLFHELPRPEVPVAGIAIVFGPGAALVAHDLLWYADVPKRLAEAAILDGTGRNLGQPAKGGRGSTRRLFYVDWPILDRHRDEIAPGLDRWLDLQDQAEPTTIDGATLRRSMATLAQRPFRTRPTFNSAPWGGHWGQEQLGHNPEAENTAIGYELIGPESGVLFGQPGKEVVEIPFQMLVALHSRSVIGDAGTDRFGTSFPIRFDFLDTVGGGNLSVHCHPRTDYMRDVFGWPYPQHESYYVMVAGARSRIYLGLQDGHTDEFQHAAQRALDRGQALDVDRYVQSHAALAHQLYLIPAGTPHGSGEGNVVLEISATPYLYSLRFYDWLRRDASGEMRSVHLGHAFANLDADRHGPHVARELIPAPSAHGSGPGWHEELIGRLGEVFFEVRRLALDVGAAAEGDTEGRFHVLSIVKGDGAWVETAAGTHRLGYAETMVVPAAVGGYRLKANGPEQVYVVKALVSAQ